MIYELFLEGQLADIRQDLGMQLNFNIDDVNKYGSRDTSFSKTIVLPGTAKNNRLLGFVGELGSSNPYTPGNDNIDANFNAAQTSKAELRANGLLLLKGVFRLTGIIHEKGHIEYEGNLFGELGGFISAIGAGKLEDLDFNAYNHTYTRDNIKNSWNTINGSGYYYPLIDYGTYSNNKIDYDYRTFRPALFAKEYMDKIFAGSEYTYESSFLNSNFFKSLIVPCNISKLSTKVTDILNANRTSRSSFFIFFNAQREDKISFPNIFLQRNVTGNGSPNFTYTGSSGQFEIDISFNIEYSWGNFVNSLLKVEVFVGQNKIYTKQVPVPIDATVKILNESFKTITNINTNDQIYILVTTNYIYCQDNSASIKIKATNPVSVDLQLGDQIIFDDLIPQNILQRDFFTWIMKMFNLYVTEDKVKEKHLLIEPYVDYYDLSDSKDWTYKVARDKAWNIKPMGMLNGRFFEYKYKEDNDFYNEGYKKKYNLPYGSILEDTKFQFAKEKQTIEIGFSPSVLIQYENTDKVVTAIYKKSSGNAVDQEERMDSNIRILMAKRIEGVDNWSIIDTGASQTFPGDQLGLQLTAYGYAGHFDDPVNPTKDINFGAASAIYFDPNVYPTNNLFNDYWSGYIAEIADKDSKLLTCHVYLNDLDIAQLDFSKPVFIDGVLWRINKIMDYDSTSGELTKVELLKVIDTGFGVTCAGDWTERNYDGTTFRNGDSIPEVTDPTAWDALTTPAWCYYNNNSVNGLIYGKLYNWYAINDPRGFAPEGYRVPSTNEWDTLISCLGGSDVAGGKMKSTSELWEAPNTGATNESGFTALPGGVRFPSGTFDAIGQFAYWWHSSETDVNGAMTQFLSYANDNATQSPNNKNYALSVRLIKEN